MRKLRKWFCDSESEESDTNSEDEEVNKDDWNSVDRREKNKIKKAKQVENRKKKQKATAQKASLMIGIGPIPNRSIDYFSENEPDYEKAKIEAVNEFLKFYLNYNDAEISELGIVVTQRAKDEMMYIVVSDQDELRDLHRRVAQAQNDEIQMRNFVPPQFFMRYMFLSKVCKNKREEDDMIKTQLRFGKSDVECGPKPRGVRSHI